MEKPILLGPGDATRAPGVALAPISQLLLWSLFAAYVAVLLAGQRYGWFTMSVGYAIAVLAILRMIWAFVGPRRNRLAEVINSPRRLVARARQNASPWARSLLTRLASPKATVTAFLALLAYVSATGMLMTASPLSGSHVMLAAHDAGVYSLLGLVFLRLTWAVLEGVAFGERLAGNASRRGRRL
jgi:cytochrome b